MPGGHTSQEADHLSPAPEVVSRSIDGEEVILNLSTGIYYGLDTVGTRIWQLLQEERSLQDISRVMLDEYDVSEEQLDADLRKLVATLRAHGLVAPK